MRKQLLFLTLTIMLSITVFVSLPLAVSAQPLLSEDWENGLGTWRNTPYNTSNHVAITSAWSYTGNHSLQTCEDGAICQDVINNNASATIYLWTHAYWEPPTYREPNGAYGSGVYELRDTSDWVIGFVEILSTDGGLTYHWNLVHFNMTSHQDAATNLSMSEVAFNTAYKVVMSYTHNSTWAWLNLWINDTLTCIISEYAPWNYVGNNVYTGSTKAGYTLITSPLYLDQIGLDYTYPDGNYTIPDPPQEPPVETKTFGQQTWPGGNLGGIGNKLVGTTFLIPDNGFANSITVYLVGSNSLGKAKCLLYSATGTFIAETVEQTITPPTWNTAYTFTFASQPQLSANESYKLKFWTPATTWQIGYLWSNQYKIEAASVTYGTSPLTIVDSTFNPYGVASIYCTYTTNGTTPTPPPTPPPIPLPSGNMTLQDWENFWNWLKTQQNNTYWTDYLEQMRSLWNQTKT